MKLTQEQIEIKLLTKLLTNISTNDFNSVRISEEDIKGLYIFGSRLWETDNEESDLDYAVVLSDTASVWKFYEKQYFQRESEDIDLHIMSESYYKNLIRECDEFGLSLFAQENPLIKYETNIEYKDLSLQNLRKSFSTKSNNSYVKAKKKLQDGELKIAYKSMYHSIRILEFGVSVALNITGNETKVFDAGDIDWIKELFEENFDNWEVIHKTMKPVFNAFASDFKKLAPKA